MVSLTDIRHLRNRMAALFALFAAGAAMAQAVEAATWLRIVFAAVAVGGAIVALVLVSLELQAESAEEAANRQKQLDERFGRFAEMLGDVDARMGAIFQLAGVAKEAPASHHGPVVELLTAYIRGHALWRTSDAREMASADTSKRRPAPDVQAALDVLGRRDRSHDEDRIELRLSDVDLRGARLRGGHFEGARLRRAHLEGAHLEGAHLQGAKFRGAHLQGANFSPDSELELEGAHLEGASFEGAHLQGARLRGAFYDSRTRWPEGFDPEAAGCHRVDARNTQRVASSGC